MAEGVNLTYEKLFDILRAEKNNAGLQKLSPTFFEDVQEYIQSKLSIIKDNQSTDNVFASKDSEETAKQLANAKKIIKMIYDLREKKIVTVALNKSRTSSSIIDTSGLHTKETTFFKDMVELLDQYRTGTLNVMLEGSKKKKVTATMQLVRFLDKVEEFKGPDDKTYGPFNEEDVANLPDSIVKMLKAKVQKITPSD